MKKFLFVIISLVFVSCGGSGEDITLPTKAPVKVPEGPVEGDKATFVEAQVIMEEYCGACHSNSPWMTNELGLKNSSVRSRTLNETMPPSSAEPRMPDDKRQRLLSFF